MAEPRVVRALPLPAAACALLVACLIARLCRSTPKNIPTQFGGRPPFNLPQVLAPPASDVDRASVVEKLVRF